MSYCQGSLPFSGRVASHDMYDYAKKKGCQPTLLSSISRNRSGMMCIYIYLTGLYYTNTHTTLWGIVSTYTKLAHLYWMVHPWLFSIIFFRPKSWTSQASPTNWRNVFTSVFQHFPSSHPNWVSRHGIDRDRLYAPPAANIAGRTSRCKAWKCAAWIGGGFRAPKKW